MMIGNGAGKGTSADGLPQLIALLVFPEPAPNDPTLRTEVGLVRGSRDQVRPLLKRLLKVWPDEPEHVGVVDDAGDQDAGAAVGSV